MSMEDHVIMVVPVSGLFGDDHFEGFSPADKVDFEARILKHFIWMSRPQAEKDYDHKQPISYALIINPKTKKVFSFQRAKKAEHYNETRLFGKWCWGTGGHIDKFDTEEGNPIHVALLREMKEEAGLKLKQKPKIFGYINYEGDDVSRVHIGMVYLIETEEPVSPNDPEITNHAFRSVEELQKICETELVEAWSKIALEPLKKYFSE